MEVVLSGAQSSQKPTNDAVSQGVTGTGGFQKSAGSTPSTVDQLGKSWSSLKKSVGEITDSATSTITTGFKSALETVSEPVLNVANSATEKAAELAGNISKNITGASSK